MNLYSIARNSFGKIKILAKNLNYSDVCKVLQYLEDDECYLYENVSADHEVEMGDIELGRILNN